MADTIEIILKITDKGTATVKEMTGSLKDLDKQAESASTRGLSLLQNAVGVGLKTALAVGTAALIAFGATAVGSINKAGGLEQQAANISAVFGSMAPPLEDVKGLISDLSLDEKLVVGIEDAGAGLQMLAQNGLTWDQIAQGAARSSILLANATGSDLATSADITTNALGIFGLQVEDLDSVVSTFVNSANKSQFGVEDWGLALANAGPKANAFGFKLEDLFAAMTLTSSAFSSGQTMGTSWAWMINGLVPNTEKAEDAMKELGLITADGANAFFDADGTGRELTEVIQLLQGALGGLTTEQQMAYSRTIFGNEAYGALSEVLKINNEELGTLIPQMTDFSAVEAGAATRTDTFQAAMAAMFDTIDAVQIMIGDKFLPIVTDLARGFAAFIKDNSEPIIAFFGQFADQLGLGVEWLRQAVETGNLFNEAFTALPVPIQGVIAAVVGIANTVKSFIQPIIALITQFFSWKDILAAVGFVIATIVLPAVTGFLVAIAPAVGVFAALVGASALLRNAWENDWLGIRSALTYAWEIIRGIFDSVMIKVGGIVDFFKIAWAAVEATNADLGTRLTVIWNMIKDVAGAVWQGIVTTVQILWPQFQAAVQEWGTAAWQWIGEAVPIALEKIREWGTALWGWVKDNAPTWIENLKTWGLAAWQWILDAIPVVKETLGKWARSIFQWLGDKLPDFLKTVLEWGTALYEWIGDAIPKAIDNLSNFIRGIREKGEGEGKSSFGSMVGQWVATLWRWIQDDLIPQVGPAFSRFITALLNYGGKLAVSLGSLAKELGLLLWEWIVDVTPIALKKISDWGGELWGWIKEKAPAWGDKLKEWGALAWQWIRDIAIPEATKKLGEWGTALWDWVKDNAPKWRDKLLEWGAAAWQWIRDEAIPNALEQLRQWGTDLFDWVKTNWPTWRDTMIQAGKDMIDWLRDGIEYAWIRLSNWFFGETAFGGFVGDIMEMLGLQLGPAYGILYENGKKITYSLNDGSRFGLPALRQTGADMGSEISSGLRANLDMHSPSRVMWGFGEDIIGGLQGGIRTGLVGLKSEMQYVADTIKATMERANSEMLASVAYFTNQAAIKAQAAHYQIANAAKDASAILKQLGIDASKAIGFGPNGELILPGVNKLPKSKTASAGMTGTSMGGNFVPDETEITTLGQALGLDNLTAQTQATGISLLGGITLEAVDLNAAKNATKQATEGAAKTAQDFIAGFTDFLKDTLASSSSVFGFDKYKQDAALRESKDSFLTYIGGETHKTVEGLKDVYQGIQNSIADILGLNPSELNVTGADSERLIDRVGQVLAGTNIETNVDFIGSLLQELVNFRSLANTVGRNPYYDNPLPTDERLTGGNTSNTYNINLMGTSNASADLINTVQLLEQLNATAIA